MEAMVNAYFDFLKIEKKVSGNTFDSYRRDINKFIEYIGEGNSLESVGSTVILNYLLSLQRSGRSPATVSRTLASVRSLYGFLVHKKYLTNDPTYGIHGFKAERKTPHALTQKQINQLLNAPVCRNVKGFRDKAMFELMYATGMKASDIIDISLSDINLKVGYIYCRNNGKERIIPIYAYARECLQSYIEKRELIKNSDKTDILFLNLSGAPLTRQGLWKIIKDYQKKVNISADITPNSLRDSFAIHLLENGADLKSVQEMLGHTDIASTQVYEKAVKDKLTKVYEKAHPRSKHKPDNKRKDD